jgi:hypothetical protein
MTPARSRGDSHEHATACVRQGESLLKIAAKVGFDRSDAGTVTVQATF